MTPHARVRLVTFQISHFCEKARWALDWHNIDYREIGWPPGLHMLLARRAGASKASVPIMMAGEDIIEGSSAIIDWAEHNSGGPRPSLTPSEETAAAREIETRLDDIIGVNVRRLVYSHALPGQSHLVKPMLFANTSPVHRLLGKMTWPLTRKLIVKAYRTGGAAGSQSRDALAHEFDNLERMIGSGQTHLSGQSFNRVQLTAASLLAPFARPDEMPVYRQARYPDTLNKVIEVWSDRPLMRWVRTLYKEYRR